MPDTVGSGAAHDAGPCARRDQLVGLDRDVRSGLPDLLHLLHRLTQLAEPALGVLGHQPDAPGKRLAAATRHAGVHEGVQYGALGLAQPGHHRGRQRRE